MNVLKKNGFKVDGKIGICFIPAVTDYFSINLKRKVVRMGYPIEKKIRYKFSRWGYGIGVSAVKMSYYSECLHLNREEVNRDDKGN